ncbi:hypothetical protein HQ563_03955 [bacterium]|nr:hypothetical protein [bacterium]
MVSRARIRLPGFLLLALLVAIFSEDILAAEEISLGKLHVAGWQPTDVDSYIGKALYDAIDGYADFHMGFNFKDSERRFFTSGEKRIEVFSYRFDSPGNAFGLFSVMRMGTVKLLKIGDEASLEGRVFHMWKGTYYVTISDLGEAACSQEEMLAFAKAVDAQFGNQYSKPSLVEALPKKNLLPFSVAYFHFRNALERLTYLGEENILQLGEDLDKPYHVEAAYGQFLVDKAKYDLIVLRYESAKKSEVAARMFMETMKETLKSSTANWPWAELVERNGKQTVIFREGNVLMFSFPTGRGDVVKTLMQQVVVNLKPKKS